MSVKRYEFYLEHRFQAEEGGEWVKYEDYAALLSATQWRPIETAPKDGFFIGFAPLENIEGIVGPITIIDSKASFDSGVMNTPTHWMPLPKPPTT